MIKFNNWMKVWIVCSILQSLSLNPFYCHMSIVCLFHEYMWSKHTINVCHPWTSEKQDLKSVWNSQVSRLTHCNQASNRSIHSSNSSIHVSWTRVSKSGIRAGWKNHQKHTNESQKPTNDLQFAIGGFSWFRHGIIFPGQVDGQLSRCAAFWIAGSTEMKTNSSQWQKLLGWQRHWHLTKPFGKSWLAEGLSGEKDWFTVSDSRFFASRLWHVNSFLDAVVAYQTFTENRHDGCFCIKMQADHTLDSDTTGNIGTTQVQPLLLLVRNIKEQGLTDIRVRKSSHPKVVYVLLPLNGHWKFLVVIMSHSMS